MVMVDMGTLCRVHENLAEERRKQQEFVDRLKATGIWDRIEALEKSAPIPYMPMPVSRNEMAQAWETDRKFGRRKTNFTCCDCGRSWEEHSGHRCPPSNEEDIRKDERARLWKEIKEKSEGAMARLPGHGEFLENKSWHGGFYAGKSLTLTSFLEWLKEDILKQDETE